MFSQQCYTPKFYNLKYSSVMEKIYCYYLQKGVDCSPFELTCLHVTWLHIVLTPKMDLKTNWFTPSGVEKTSIKQLMGTYQIIHRIETKIIELHPYIKLSIQLYNITAINISTLRNNANKVMTIITTYTQYGFPSCAFYNIIF